MRTKTETPKYLSEFTQLVSERSRFGSKSPKSLPFFFFFFLLLTVQEEKQLSLYSSEFLAETLYNKILTGEKQVEV